MMILTMSLGDGLSMFRISPFMLLTGEGHATCIDALPAKPNIEDPSDHPVLIIIIIAVTIAFQYLSIIP